MGVPADTTADVNSATMPRPSNKMQPVHFGEIRVILRTLVSPELYECVGEVCTNDRTPASPSMELHRYKYKLYRQFLFDFRRVD
jgi:hypothetical protein